MFITPLNFPMYSQFSIHNFHFYGSSGLGTSCFHLHSNWQNKSFLRIEGEIIKDDGLNRNLSNCWVIKDTFVYLCWEMLTISLKENIKTVRKILRQLQINVFSASIATTIATTEWREGAIINTFTHFTISTILPLKVLDCCCPLFIPPTPIWFLHYYCKLSKSEKAFYPRNQATFKGRIIIVIVL